MKFMVWILLFCLFLHYLTEWSVFLYQYFLEDLDRVVFNPHRWSPHPVVSDQNPRNSYFEPVASYFDCKKTKDKLNWKNDGF